jgi:hypothetical protein
MINNLIKLNVPKVSATLSFNVLLHVTILFIILSIFFTQYVSKVSSNIINSEIKSIVKDGIDKSSTEILKIKKKLTESINLQNYLIEMFENTDDVDEKIDIKTQIEQTFNTINLLKDKINLDEMKKKFPYDYYVNFFSQDDVTRKSINNEVFFYIKFTCVLLISILLLFLYYLLNTNSITVDQIKEISIENILTFIFVGIIEFVFFTNVAMKYIPSEPSLIFKSLLNGLNKEF